MMENIDKEKLSRKNAKVKLKVWLHRVGGI